MHARSIQTTVDPTCESIAATTVSTAPLHRLRDSSFSWFGDLQYAKIFAIDRQMIERMPELRTLSPSDKLALVTELWDDLASNPDDIPITAEQIAEVDKRLEEYRKNPDLGTTWEQVKARILGQNR